MNILEVKIVITLMETTRMISMIFWRIDIGITSKFCQIVSSFRSVYFQHPDIMLIITVTYCLSTTHVLSFAVLKT